MQTWSRHEKEDHEGINFPCMPNGVIEFTRHGRECALCGLEPTEEHLRSHNIEQCTQLKHVFKRRNELSKHLELHGVARRSRLSDMLMTKWQRVPEKRAWACGFCKGLFSSLTEFHKHIAVQHYECGEGREWDHTKVILGLLSQPHVAESWERLLATRFQVHSFLSCKWKKSKARELQFRLELGREPGDVLALAALGSAIYDHNLLKDSYRHGEPSNSDMDSRSMADESGPPVPPKPLPSVPSSQDQSSSNTRIPDRIRKADIPMSDRFQTSSSQLFNSMPDGMEPHTHPDEQCGRGWLDQLTGNDGPNPINLGAIGMDWDFDFSPQLSFPFEVIQNSRHQGDEH
ncbi:MAG: hypothetical protein Q9184_002102 [Pyrenodesmia sp. 2 TL-2023]